MTLLDSHGIEVPVVQAGLGAASAATSWPRRSPGPAAHRVVRNQATESGTEEPLAPLAATDDGPPELVDAGPLYAGEAVARIDEVRPAAEIVARLMP